jgi:hypothetical protein
MLGSISKKGGVYVKLGGNLFGGGSYFLYYRENVILAVSQKINLNQ